MQQAQRLVLHNPFAKISIRRKAQKSKPTRQAACGQQGEYEHQENGH
jgi:hypothetical protein